MKQEVELFTLEAARREQEDWSPELHAFAGMVAKVRGRHFGMSINEAQMQQFFEELVADLDDGEVNEAD